MEYFHQEFSEYLRQDALALQVGGNSPYKFELSLRGETGDSFLFNRDFYDSLGLAVHALGGLLKVVLGI